MLLQRGHEGLAGVVDHDGVLVDGEHVQVDVGAGGDRVVVLVLRVVVGAGRRRDHDVPPAQGLGQEVHDARVAQQQGAGAQWDNDGVDVALGEPVHAVDAEPSVEVAPQPVEGECVVGVGDVDDQVAAEAQAVGPVDHRFQAHVVRRRLRVERDFDVGGGVGDVGGVEGVVGHHRARHGRPAGAGAEVLQEDRFEELGLEVAVVQHGRRLDDLVAHDQGVVAEVERRGDGGLEGGGGDPGHLRRGRQRPVHRDAERGELRGEAFDVLDEFAEEALLLFEAVRGVAVAAFLAVAPGREGGVVAAGSGEVVADEHVERHVAHPVEVAVRRPEDDLLQQGEVVVAVQTHRRGPFVGRRGVRACVRWPLVIPRPPS
ncbi:hypothetical protein EQK42_02545 [Streptomyces albidoflavus]|nr:hypothetical protein EQK42_02545 [Streptomyces albidoflavus]